jgi:hypothetical protein
MIKRISVCKNCGHPIGKVPKGLYILRDDGFVNIRIRSSGRDWLHVVEYERDRKLLGTAQVPQFMDELKEIEKELNHQEEMGIIKDDEVLQFKERMRTLQLAVDFIVQSITGPNRDSRMFTIRCWGKTGRCKCINAEPEAQQ